ncbi:hypothetical protein Scep_002432 [Stephania cephalantha]|uniref:Uncharacterized protein n=1 Tax=Stephania cephalantha TaxID=152367 RepID=A0AAP0LA59_9MAGN
MEGSRTVAPVQRTRVESLAGRRRLADSNGDGSGGGAAQRRDVGISKTSCAAAASGGGDGGAALAATRTAVKASKQLPSQRTPARRRQRHGNASRGVAHWQQTLERKRQRQ